MTKLHLEEAEVCYHPLWVILWGVIWISRVWVILEKNKLLYLPTNLFIPASFHRGIEVAYKNTHNTR